MYIVLHTQSHAFYYTVQYTQLHTIMYAMLHTVTYLYLYRAAQSDINLRIPCCT